MAAPKFTIQFCIFLIIYLIPNSLGSGPGLQLVEESRFPDEIVKPISPRYILPHDYRLPEGLVPEHYIVNIRPILDEGDDGDINTAPGSVKMFLTCTKSMSIVTFNSLDIDIDETSIEIKNEGDGTVHTFHNVTADVDLQIIEIRLNPGQELSAGMNYSVSMSFTAKIPRSLLGMYYRTYPTPTGETKKIVLTKLEAVGARMVFPCFDEPALKATYQINIAHTAKYNTLCNMRIVQQTEDPDLPEWTWDEYEPTVKMSTYLIAIIVSEFTSVEAPPGLYDKPVKTWAAPHHIEAGGGDFAASETAKVLQFFSELYDLEYPLPKMYSAGILDFSSGAMEQYGLITYRDDYLLYFPGVSAENNRVTVSGIISHEVAHQWFGNIVTLEWWENLWLNEGFASYIEEIGVGQTLPEFERSSVPTGRINAMVVDAGATTKPVHYNENNLSGIVYDKASYIIKMMERFLSAATFQKGVNRYLKAHQFGNAIQDNLFEKLTEAGHEDGKLNDTLTVKGIMDTWTRQTGFPLVRVGRISATKVYVTQERFGTTPRLGDGSAILNPDDLWTVPLSFATKSAPDFTLENQVPKFWLDKTSTFRTLDVSAGDSDWIVTNVDASAYFRVIYDEHLTNALKAQLDSDHKVISKATRSQIIDDYFKSAFANYIPIESALGFTTYLDAEETLMVWQTFFSNFRSSYTLLKASPEHAEAFKEYISKKLIGGLNTVGVKQLPEHKGANVLLRGMLLDWACSLGLEICTDYAMELFTEWKETPSTSPVPVDIQPIMYCAMAYADKEAFDFLLGKYSSESVKIWPYNVKAIYRNALACTSEASSIDRVLNLALQPEDFVPTSDALELLVRLSASTEGRAKVTEFLKTNLYDIVANRGVNFVRDTIAAQANHWSQIEKRLELEEFIMLHAVPLEPIIQSLKQSGKIIENNVKWMNTFGNGMKAWFDEMNPTEPPTESPTDPPNESPATEPKDSSVDPDNSTPESGSFGTKITSSYMTIELIVPLILSYYLI